MRQPMPEDVHGPVLAHGPAPRGRLPRSMSVGDPQRRRPRAGLPTARGAARRHRHADARASRWANDTTAVTPVIGSILVLAITVLGIAGVLLWGAPTVQRIQERGAQLGVIGEFDDLRASALALSVPDAARVPTIVVQKGVLGIETAGSIMVSANHDVDRPDCDVHVQEWSTMPADTFKVVLDGPCRTIKVGADCASVAAATEACLEVLAVSGNNLVASSVSAMGGGSYLAAGADLTAGDWLFRLTNAQPLSLEVHMQAYLLRSDMHVWRLDSAVDERAVYHDGGVVFSRTGADSGARWFVETDLPMQEDAFGSGDFVLWLRTFDAEDYDAVEATGTSDVFLGLIGTYARIRDDDATLLRFDFEGELASAWCEALMQRNPGLAYAGYSVAGDCDDDVPSVAYQGDAIRSPFTFELLHANVRTYLL